jgi:hypothetical protein
MPGMGGRILAAQPDAQLAYGYRGAKRAGYRIEIVYLRLASPRLAQLRERVPSASGCVGCLRQLGITPDPGGEGAMKGPKKPRRQSFAAAVGRALRRAGAAARKTARMHGTPIYVWKDGKVVAEKP